ncbi:Protein TSSC1 [Symbiodinium microadriaticum]|uniref:Protein TSSC1 n=1 Tax=Symbiodinium microadriaticum TaxID=2951 RepID=A0A1Q9E272_SYMMI|nr:Protein TSSC1 [Symbiodinium microadriaticum]
MDIVITSLSETKDNVNRRSGQPAGNNRKYTGMAPWFPLQVDDEVPDVPRGVSVPPTLERHQPISSPRCHGRACGRCGCGALLMAAPPRAGVWLCRQPSRVVAAVPGDPGRHRFMVGTCDLQNKNQIHVVEFSEETAEVSCKQSFEIEDEVWLISPSPSDSQTVLTSGLCHSGGKSSPSLRLIRTDGSQVSQQPLALSDEDNPLSAVKTALWDPHQEGCIVVADAEAVQTFNVGGGKLSRQVTLHVGQRCMGACLDPHHRQQLSTVDDGHLKTWDLRTSRLAFRKDGVHLFGAKDVDYNPNVPYQVLTTGEDACLRFWDLRQLSTCLRSLSGGHHHWVVKARFNAHHDQLVLSCGTDSMLCLWRATSVASAPLGGKRGEEAARASDGLVRKYEEHEDSCYSCCWSSSDAWVFASVSFDGKLVVNRVPDEEKYRSGLGALKEGLRAGGRHGGSRRLRLARGGRPGPLARNHPPRAPMRLSC